MHRCKKRSERNKKTLKNVKKRNRNKRRLKTLNKKRSSPMRNALIGAGVQLASYPPHCAAGDSGM